METPYPSITHYGPIKTSYGDLLPSCELLRTRQPLLRTPQDLYHPLRTTLYNMADISKQVNKGQKKWWQGVNIISIYNVNNYIKFKTLKYKYFKLINNNL